MAIGALVLSWVPILGILLGGAALILAVRAFKPGASYSYLTWATVLASLALVFGLGSTVAAFSPSDDEPTLAADAGTAGPAERATAEPSASEEPAPAAVSGAVDESSPTLEATPTPKPKPKPKKSNLPGSEVDFIKHVTSASEDYDEAATDLQQSQVVKKRNRAICADLPDGNFDRWLGEVKDVGANGEGKAYVTVEIDDGIQIQTWNNAFSDTGDSTLIPEASPFFDTLTGLVPGDKVAVSGSFVGESGSCIKTGNMTEVFGVIDPHFIVRFADVVKR